MKKCSLVRDLHRAGGAGVGGVEQVEDDPGDLRNDSADTIREECEERSKGVV